MLTARLVVGTRTGTHIPAPFITLHQAALVLLLAVVSSSARPQSLPPGFEKTGAFAEQTRWTCLDSGVRVLVDAPATLNGRRHLVVVAYDDREVTFGGKKVVGPDGGTFRASQRMLNRFRREVELIDRDPGPFHHSNSKNGQIQFFIHRNPGNKILHTALVGEMNGLVHALTLGTEHEEKWGRFGGPRAYTGWIQPLYVGHGDRYVDYSHGVRLLAEQMIVDGRTLKVSDVLKDKQLCGLVSNEGPIDDADVRKAAGWAENN